MEKVTDSQKIFTSEDSKATVNQNQNLIKNIPQKSSNKNVKVNDAFSSHDISRVGYGYIRVSTIMQVEDGISLTNQADKIKNYCALKNIALAHTYQDAGISGGSILYRTQLKEVLNLIQRGQCLIVAELSRLSRRNKDAVDIFEALREKGATLISISPDVDFSTPSGELMYNMMMSMHQMERQQISERVKSNMQTLSSLGKLRGRPSYGYKFISKEKDFEVDEEQQKVIEYIIVLYEDKKNMSQIAKILNEEGHNATLKITGQLFYPNTVRNILLQRGYLPNKNTQKELYIKGRAKNNTNENI